MTVIPLYTFVGVFLFATGLAGLFFCPGLFRKILAANLASSGVFLVLITLARRRPDAPPDPVPHALVLTGIVVAVSATAVALALYRRLTTFVDREPEETSVR